MKMLLQDVRVGLSNELLELLDKIKNNYVLNGCEQVVAAYCATHELKQIVHQIGEKFIDHINNEVENGNLPNTNKAPQKHDFDSSWTCGACGAVETMENRNENCRGYR